MFLFYISAQANIEDKGKHIDQLMKITGMSDSVQHLTDQVVQGLDSTAEGSMSDGIFTPSEFVESITLALKEHYEPGKYSKLIKVFSSAIAQRMLNLEKQDSAPTEMQSFFEGLQKAPLTGKRMKLIRKLDTLVGASQLGNSMSLPMLEAISLSYAVDCPVEKAKIYEQLAANKGRFEKVTQGSTLSTFAFVYRDISNKDLSDYIDIYKDEDVRWFQKLVNATILERYLFSINDLTKTLSENVRAEKKSQSMFTPKCGDKPDLFLKLDLETEKVSKEMALF